MIIDYDRRPNATEDEKLQSLVENIQLALNSIDAGTLTGNITNNVSINAGTLNGTIDGDYLFVKNLDADSITAVKGWIDKLLVQTHLLANEGEVFELDAIQVNASRIKTGTLDVERLIYTNQTTGEKYLVHFDPDGSTTYEKLDGNVIEDLTITADKIVSESIMARHITTQNIEGTGGWINLRNGTFFYGNGATYAAANNAISWDGSKLKIKADDFELSSGKSIFEEIEAIETWFYAVAPTTSNEPAKNWNTEKLKELHLRDIYFDTTSGKSYRWAKDGTTYKWVEIEDVELAAVTRRLSDAETSITKNADSIVSLASANETYVKPDGATATNKLRTQIKQNADAISLKANSTDVYTKAEADAAITVSAQGIEQRVSSTYQTKSDMSNYPTTTQMNSAISQSAGEITASVSSTYETKNDATSKLNTAKGYTDSEITTAKAAIKVTTDEISTEVSKKVGSSEVISKINQSAETVKIQASKVEIDGTATFNAIKDEVENTANTAVDNIEIGGRNLARGTADMIKGNGAWSTGTWRDSGASNTYNYTVSDSPVASVSKGVLVTTKVANTRYGVCQDNCPMLSKKITFSVWAKGTAGGTITLQSVWWSNIPSSTHNGKTVTATGEWQYITFTADLTNATVPNGKCSICYLYWNGDNVNDTCVFVAPKLEYGTKATAWSPAPEDIEAAAVAEEQYIYISKAPGTTSVNGTTSWVTKNEDKQNVWTTKRPTYDSSYPVLFVAKQKKVVDGTVTCTTPLKDDTTTIIDGGTIITGTVNANAVNASSGTFDVANIPNLNASKITAGDIAADRMKANSITAINSLTTGKINAERLDVGSITVGSLKDGQELIDNTVKSSDYKEGSIVSWSNMLIDKLVADIEPIQSLNGYDKPWVGGAGKNKLHVTATTRTVNGITYTVNANGTVKAVGTSTGNALIALNDSIKLPAGSYTGSLGTVPTSIYWYIYNFTTSSDLANRNNPTFTYNGTDTIGFRVLIGPNQTVNNDLYPMIRLSSVSDATFAPYSNICPISGRTEVVTHRTGKNLLKNTATDNTLNGIKYTVNADGSVTGNGTATGNANCTIFAGYFLKSGSYIGTAKGATNDLFGTISLTHSDGSATTYIDMKSSADKPFTVVEGDRIHYYIHSQNGKVVNNITIYPMIRLASDTDATYEPYQGTTYTTALGRTVYGGTLDVVSGVLTVDRAMVDLGTLTWMAYGATASYDRYITAGIDSTVKEGTVGLSSHFQGTRTFAVGNIVIGSGSSKLSAFTAKGQYASASAFKTAINGATFVYELATPQTYQLTPQQVSALVGENNLWTNSGTVHVTLTGVKDDTEAIANAAKTATTYITDIGNDGIRIHDSHTTNNSAVINSSGMEIFKGGTDAAHSVAKYGDTLRIGKNENAHIEMDYHSMQLKDRGSNTYFHVSDLRDSDGIAVVQSQWTATNNQTSFYAPMAIVEVVSVTVNGTETTDYTVSRDYYIEFTSGKSAGDVVIATYKTRSVNAKAYTLGRRKENSAVGAMSHAEGLLIVASGLASHAEGYTTTASGDYSHAEGRETTASGRHSHAEGYKATASGDYSHAEGDKTTASGEYAHAEGLETTAKYCGHAEGYSTSANGLHSHAGGYMTIADGQNQTVIGSLNVAQGTSYDHVTGDYIFIIGNGDTRSGTRSNALTVTWGGTLNVASGYQVNSKDFISVQRKSDDNLTIAKGATTEFRFSAARTGYTPIGIVGFDLDNASSSGTNMQTVWFSACRLDGTNVLVQLHNSGASASKVKVCVDVLYIAT